MDQKKRTAEIAQFYKNQKEERKVQLGKDEKYYAAKRAKKTPEPFKHPIEKKGSLTRLASKAVAKGIAKRAMPLKKGLDEEKGYASVRKDLAKLDNLPEDLKEATKHRTMRKVMKKDAKYSK